MKVKLKPGATAPSRATAGAAGYDLYAYAPAILYPGDYKLVDVGFSMTLPPGHEAQIRPRSGLALKHGITVLNSPGTIDEDYTGDVKVLLLNCGAAKYEVEPGSRIAQMVIAKYEAPEIEIVDNIVVTWRGDGGFGSTGS